MKRFVSTSRALAFVVTSSLMTGGSALAEDMVFRNTITGEAMDPLSGKKGPDTEAVKEFLATGRNIYRWDEAAIKAGGEHFLTACSGCHGHEAEGKVGPALRDDYWTYPKNNKTDKGLFETMFGGAQAMMGPQLKQLTVDEMLQIIAWIRAVYVGDPEKADWMSEDERKGWKGPLVTFTHAADAGDAGAAAAPEK